MTDAPDQEWPWYAAGLAFECGQCGQCCSGPEEGYVWVTRSEIAAIAKYLGISAKEMRRRYVRKVARRFSLNEKHPGNDCIFLERRDGEGPGCAIYPVRPTQCRTWPFWDGNLVNVSSWSIAGIRCKGINRGRLVEYDEIEDRRRRTRE
jgi:Fe-S-cluster containining protein